MRDIFFLPSMSSDHDFVAAEVWDVSYNPLKIDVIVTEVAELSGGAKRCQWLVPVVKLYLKKC